MHGWLVGWLVVGMAPQFDGARFIGRDWSGLVQSQGGGGGSGHGSSHHHHHHGSSNGTTAQSAAVDLGVDHSNANTWIAPFSFQTSNYAHSNGKEQIDLVALLYFGFQSFLCFSFT